MCLLSKITSQILFIIFHGFTFGQSGSWSYIATLLPLTLNKCPVIYVIAKFSMIISMYNYNETNFSSKKSLLNFIQVEMESINHSVLSLLSVDTHFLINSVNVSFSEYFVFTAIF